MRSPKFGVIRIDVLNQAESPAAGMTAIDQDLRAGPGSVGPAVLRAALPGPQWL